MKIEIKLSIPTLLRKFDEHFITSNDIETLAVIRNFITSMREQVPEGTTANLFPQEVRAALASAMNDAVADIIKTVLAEQAKLAKQTRGRAAPADAPKPDGRKLSPEVAAEREKRKRDLLDAQVFKGRIASLSDTLATFCILAKSEQRSSMERRQEKFPELMTTVIDSVMALQAAAKDTFATDMKEMVEQTMPRFEALVTRWMHLEAMSDEFNPAKGEFFINWQATLRSLSRDATERIRQLKG